MVKSTYKILISSAVLMAILGTLGCRSKDDNLKIENEDTIREMEKTTQIIELNGYYKGTIKDGTQWAVSISDFDGKNFKGYDIIYWKSTPEGIKANLTGTFNDEKNEILMLEDINIKGAGKFIGTISENGKIMNGSFFRYSDNDSYDWSLVKSNREITNIDYNEIIGTYQVGNTFCTIFDRRIYSEYETYKIRWANGKGHDVLEFEDSQEGDMFYRESTIDNEYAGTFFFPGDFKEGEYTRADGRTFKVIKIKE